MPNLYQALNGRILHIYGADRIYWIDTGLARHIVDEDTYHGVFGPNPHNDVNDELGDITLGPDVANGTLLVRASDFSEIYLIDQLTKRYIPSEAIKAKYNLNGIVHSIPPYVLSSIPDGPPFS